MSGCCSSAKVGEDVCHGLLASVMMVPGVVLSFEECEHALSQLRTVETCAKVGEDVCDGLLASVVMVLAIRIPLQWDGFHVKMFLGARKAPVSATPCTIPLFPLHCKNQNRPPLPSSAVMPST